MKKAFYFAVAVALLMASSTARASEGMSFNPEGQKIRIEAPRNCNSLSCVSGTKNGSPIGMKNKDFKDRKSDDDAATSSLPPAPLALPAPAIQAAPAPAPVANAAPPGRPAPPMQQVAAVAATTPLGLWQTDKGNLRVELCGTNLCGYGEKNSEKTKELVLINMKPSSDNSKWTGRIHDPTSGKDYDATITMEGPNQLKVQGCALGGMFCGSATWRRIN